MVLYQKFSSKKEERVELYMASYRVWLWNIEAGQFEEMENTIENPIIDYKNRRILSFSGSDSVEYSIYEVSGKRFSQLARLSINHFTEKSSAEALKKKGYSIEDIREGRIDPWVFTETHYKQEEKVFTSISNIDMAKEEEGKLYLYERFYSPSSYWNLKDPSWHILENGEDVETLLMKKIPSVFR